jgi:hypothetical protein
MAIFELSKDRQTGVYGVEVFLKKSPSMNELIPLTIPGCDQFCPLDTLARLLEPVRVEFSASLFLSISFPLYTNK